MPLELSDSRFLNGRRAAPTDLPAADLRGYSAVQLADGARAWSRRATFEHHSAAVFADAVAFLVDADVALDVAHAFARAVSDELRHTELCVAVAARLGGPPAPNELLRRPPTARSREARRARALEIVAIQGAVGETLSCDFLLASVELAEEPGVAAALHEIRRDETIHARQAWESLAVIVPTLDDAARAALHAHLRVGLGGVEHNIALPAVRQAERKERHDPALSTLGILPPEARAEAFYSAMERRVLPALDELGLDGKLAWAERKRTWGDPDAG